MTSSRGDARLLILFVASGLAAAFVGFAGAPEARFARFERYGLALVAGNLVLVAGAAAFVAMRRARFVRPSWQTLRALAGLAVVVVAFVLASPSTMRIQADETLVASTAFGIWTGAGPVVPTGLFRPDGVLEVTSFSHDKRGLLVPSLIATLHFLGGYRFDQGFWLNHVAAWLALAAVYSTAREWLSPIRAFAAALFLASFPVFAWAATSQTLEAVNLAMMFGSAALMAAAARNGDAAAALLVALAGPLLAQARYESAVVGVLSLPIAALVVTRSARPRAALGLLAVPWLYLPAAWQRGRAFDYDLTGAEAEVAFSFGHFVANLGDAARHLTSVYGFNPSGALVPSLALATLAFGVRRMPPERPGTRVVALYALAIVALTAIVLAFAWGGLSRPETQRLGLPLFALLSLAAASLLAGAGRLEPAVSRGLVVAAGIAAIATTRVLPHDVSSQRLLGTAMVEAQREARSGFPHCQFLWVGPSAPYFVLHGESAITTAEALRSWPALGARAGAHGVDAILALQVVDVPTGFLLDDARLPAGFMTRPVLSGRVGLGGEYRVFQLQHAQAPLVPAAGNTCELARATQAR